MTVTTFFHFSDFHILPKKGMTRDEGDPCSKVEKLIEIAEETGIAPSLSIVTGDISQNGSQSGYNIAKEYMHRIEQLGGPVLPVMGNVDTRDSFRRNLLKRARDGKQGPCYYARTVEGIRVIVLDSQNPEKPTGELKEPQLTWLKRQLLVEGPNIIALHHPPFTLQLPNGTQHTLFDDQDEMRLKDFIKPSNTTAILCGHLHQSLVTQMNGVNIIVGPAALSEALYNDRETRTYDASGFTIHTLIGNRLTSRPLCNSGNRELIKTTPITE